MEKFNIEKFINEYNYGELRGLEYLGRTLIAEMEEKDKDSTVMTREYYLINLYHSVMNLNNCNAVYEMTYVKTNFNWDVYANVRDLLFKELEIEKFIK